MTMKKHHHSQDHRFPPPPDILQRSWTPFILCEADPRGDEILIYRNSRYQVHVRRMHATNGSPDLIHLSMKRLDQLPAIPYRDRMRIKDELWGPEYEAVELLPARSREIDLSNQTHLWLIDSPSYRFPFGFAEGRYVSDFSLDGAVQEPWPPDERPADCLSEDALRALLRRERGETHQ